MPHAAHFPAYRARSTPERTLALYEDKRLILESGEVLDAAGWYQLREALETERLLILCKRSLKESPLLRDAVDDADASVLLTKAGAIAGIRCRERRDRRRAGWLVPLSAWGPLAAESQPLAALRTLYDTLGVGVAPTPSALGTALLRCEWRGAPAWRPAVWYDEQIRAALVGGRADLPLANVGKRYPRAWGQDMTGAYPWAAQSVPAGSCVQFWGEPPAYLATYVQQCRIDPPDHPPALGPLPQKVAWNSQREYPPYAVLWGTWWKEELEDAKKLGYSIDRGKGIGWQETTDALVEWSKVLHALRASGLSDTLRAICKLVGVATLGRFGQEWETRTLVPLTEETDMWCDEETGFAGSAYGVKVERRDRESLQIHLSSYIHMQVRRALYKRAAPYAERGTLIATNFDEVLTSEPPTERANGSVLGGWKQHEYVNLRVPYPRAKLADGITPILPGRPYKLRRDDDGVDVAIG